MTIEKITRLTRHYSSLASNQKKSTISLSIDKYILDEIRNEARVKGLSANAKINAILTKYVNYDQYREHSKDIHLTNKSFKFILDNISETKLLQDFRENIMDLIPGIFIERNIPMTLDNLIKHFFQDTGINAGIYHHFTYFKGGRDGEVRLVLRHNYGIKWSNILSITFCGELERLLRQRVNVKSILPSSIVIELSEKPIRNVSHNE